MPLDASIYARFAPKSVSDYDLEAANVQGAQQTNALNALRLQAGNRAEADAQRTLQEQTGVRNALTSLGGGATDDQRINALRSLGTQTGFAQADALEKSSLERQKVGADVKSKLSEADKRQFDMAHERLAAFNNLLAGVKDQPSYEAAIAQGKMLGVDPASVPPQYDPAYISSAQQRSISEQQRLENAAKQRGYDLTASGQQQALGIAQMNDARMKAEGAANRGVTMRGQNLTDARARDTTTATMTKPFEVTGPDGQPMLVQQDKQGNISPVQGYGPKAGSAKPLTDSQAKALLFGTRMQESDKIIGDLASKGTTHASLGQQLTSGEGLSGALATALASPEQQQVDQAQRDFINAVLRRESGAAISPSEFQSARKQYFVQPGDSAPVTDQKSRNRKLAISGLLAEVPAGQRTSITPTATTGVPDDIAALLKKHGGK